MKTTQEYLTDTEEQEFEQTGWTITDDALADWAIEKIAQAQAEIDRMTADCVEKVKKITERLDSFATKHQQAICFFETQLQRYVETLDVKPTKAGTKIYNLPSGKVSIKPQAPKFNVSDTDFIAWLKMTGKQDLIISTEKGQWGELKKSGIIVGEDGTTVLTADGEIIEGISAELREDVVKVEVL